MADSNDKRRYRGGSPLTRSFFRLFGIMSVREEKERAYDE